MATFIEQMSGLEILFATCAVFGGLLFLFRLVLMFLGHAGGADVDGHVDVDALHDIDGADFDGTHDFSDSDVSFKLLSLQGITAFFMMFGLVGWAMVRQGHYHPILPIVCGTGAGLATVWIMKAIFEFAGKLQSSGNLNLQNAVGQTGVVYLTIHPDSGGKVQISIQNRLSILDAVSESNEDIKTGDTVRVIKVTAGRLVVEKQTI